MEDDDEYPFVVKPIECDFSIGDNTNIFSGEFHEKVSKKRSISLEDGPMKKKVKHTLKGPGPISNVSGKSKKQSIDSVENKHTSKRRKGSISDKVPDENGSKKHDISDDEEPFEKKNQQSSNEWKDFINQTPSLSNINDMVNKLSGTNSINDKVKIMENHSHCVRALYYCSNPFWQYYVSSARVKKSMNDLSIRSQAVPVQNLFHLLDLLKSREITGNKAIGTVCNFVQANKVPSSSKH